MPTVQDFMLVSVILAVLLFGTISTVPTCERTDEDCKDERMHPKLPVTITNGKNVNLRVADSSENTNNYWRNKGIAFVKNKLNSKQNSNRAKNVIMFLGDGMGLTTVATARNLLGGEEQFLSFENFPYTGLAKTYSVSHIVPDSAGTATAYLCGVKTRSGTLGVNAQLPRSSCQNTENTDIQVNSIAKWAMDAGKSAGVVTTTRITHASPAGAYSHITERNWEYDVAVTEDCGENSNIRDIADQLINGEIGSQLQVIFGGGRRYFVDQGINENGYRNDGRNLIEEFKSKNLSNVYVSNRNELMETDLLKANRIMGLFAESHLKYHLATVESDNQPTLSEMTQKAIEKLSQNENGYFLFIEGGRIDHGHHDNKARYALDETIELSKAVQTALNITNLDDTLIIVTADHSHAFSYSGYAPRGNDIFSTTKNLAEDGFEYMTLSYANGPGFNKFYNTNKGKRRNPKNVDISSSDAEFPATYTLSSETHGGDDVPVFAIGPQSHLFTGVYDQNVLPHTMAYAACIGSGLKLCNT